MLYLPRNNRQSQKRQNKYNFKLWRFEVLWKKISWLCYQYILVTALYMLKPLVRTIFNSILISVAGMAVNAGYVRVHASAHHGYTTLL
uniref:Uncharacterized protein n=1 Tax=Oncorhynchus kisutch TaxID=8019 RepID=A0A8C7DQT2_ONCKI